jgi:anti-anti-sigma regulatory factor
MARRMPFRIENAALEKLTVLTLSGRIDAEAISELRRLCELQTGYSEIVLDLKAVSVVSRAAVLFFVSCEEDGVKLENCARYIREWMEREKIQNCKEGETNA